MWNENERLSWYDFKGLPNSKFEAAALTATGLTFDFSARATKTKLLDFTAVVEARFYPDKSWYLKKYANPVVLAHEQLHFDITELYARKLRKQIAETNFTIKIQREISKLHFDINKQLKEMQNDYDRESDYSRILVTQQKWQDFVYDELNKLSKYKLTSF
ncbi:MAG: DUF922 domain-containing protein [Bacteroidia bacterium]|nr:DUF922 domain-containing protein [Bacteroidia bacterium]